MPENASEKIFRDYLNSHSFEYEENFVVGDQVQPKNVDFFIKSSRLAVYADVKEVRASQQNGKVDADRNIRKDIKNLRDKFGHNRPVRPVVLVTMNFSSRFFTGLTFARALLGEVGAYFDTSGRSPIQHLPRGNAALTQRHNRIISAVLGFDRVNLKHFLFKSPFADHPVPDDFFPLVQVIELDRKADEDTLADLGSIMFLDD